MNMFFYLMFGCTLFCSIGLAALLTTSKKARARNVRVLEVIRPGAGSGKPKAKDLNGVVVRLLRDLRARLGASENPKLRERLLAAGIKSPDAGETYFAAQML